MCGIAIALSQNSSLKHEFSEGANDLLSHRGPDGHGKWEDDKIVLIHRRLSIIDLSEAGHQPMISSTGRFVMIFNGEIYNHLSLRKQFLPGHSFRGHSDSETLIELFQIMGQQMLRHLVGMWAMAIWDKAENRLFISRDRFGQKPLYWSKVNDAWIFSSEIKPILPFLNKRTANATALVEYLAVGNYGHLGEDTFINEVKSFLPGHYLFLESESKELNPVPYWSVPERSEKEKTQFGEREKEQLQSLVIDAVQSQTLSDVPIGMTLSGGLDSSVIAGILASHSTAAIQVFSASNKGNRYDEAPYAQSVFDHWKSKNVLIENFIEMDSMSISEHLDNGLAIQEEPFGDPSILSHLQLMEAAHRKGIKVILGGQGADEIFCGYDSVFHSLIGGYLRAGQFRQFYKLAKDLKLSSATRARITLGAFAPEIFQATRRSSRNRRRSFINAEIREQADNSKIHLANPSDFVDNWKESISGVHLPHLVHYDDRNGMANSVEGRMPFLDHRLIEFISTIRPEEFVRNGIRKYLLKESCQSFLPNKIYTRQDKIGFFAPIHEMIKNDIDFLREGFRSQVFPLKFINDKVLHDDLHFYENGKIDVIKARRIWRAYSYGSWVRQFKITI